jgi:Na+-driven multidrug efflux pump
MLPYVARRYGARDGEGIRRGLREAHVAGLAYVGVLFLILPLAARPLATAFSSSPLTSEHATFALRMVPFACLASLPFFLCRPAFEGMGQGRPGLYAAVLRYLVLTAPAAWLGMQAAEALGRPAFQGLVVALVVAAALTSALFLAWMRAALRAPILDPAPEVSPPALQ